MEIETLNHLFWECIHVQHFWTNLSVFLQEYNILIQFNLRNVMLGITEGTNITEIQIKNFIILLGKYFIFKTKYQKQYPTLKTYAAISNAHLFRVCKRGKLSGSCLSTLNGFGSIQLPIFLCHIGVPTFSSQNN